MSTRLSLNVVRTDGGTQSRAQLNGETVTEYADALKAGVAFPDVVVFYDGEQYWVADGFHRVAASLSIGLDEIRCDVRQGSVRDARLFSAGANAQHGLKRTNADKRRAVEMLIADEEWAKRSAEWIAQRCGVSGDLVLRVRAALQPPKKEVEPTIGRDGKERRMPEKKAEARPPVEEAPAAPSTNAGAEYRRSVGEANTARIMPLIAEGHSRAEVARALSIHPTTVSGVVARNTKTNPLERPLAYVEEVEGVISLWSSNFQPKWDTADSEQRNAMLLGVKAMVAAANSFARRLKESGSSK